MALPAVNLLQAATSSLRVSACIWPPTPLGGVTTHVLVDVLNTADRTAIHGPWAQIEADWDMATMSMGTQHARLPGEVARGNVVSLPLTLTMAGPWWADVVIHTPGRPVWQARLSFTVAASTTATLPTARGQPGTSGAVADACATQKGP
jgi:hypothetical protein